METAPLTESLADRDTPPVAVRAEDESSSALVLAAVTQPGAKPDLLADQLGTAAHDREIGTEPPLPARIGALPVQLDIRIPLATFRVGDLRALCPGAVLETNWPATDDLPFGSGETQLLWVEFEVVDLKLSARVTRVA